MPFKNVVDDTSTANTAASPGWTVDLRNHTTHRLRSQGVPVRFKVCVNSTAGNDTGAIKLVDETGAAVLTCLVNNPAATTSAIGDWYWVDGYVPATLAKYDVHYGGNTLGTLTPLSASLYEIDWTTDPVTGSASLTLGTMTVEAYVPFSGDLSSTLDAMTISAAGAVEITGAASPTLDAMTVASTGTVAATPVNYQAVGAATDGATTDIPWPTHAANDYAILVAIQGRVLSSADPGAATLSTASGFTAVTGGSKVSQNVGGSQVVRVTLFEKRAASGSEAAPQIANVSGYGTTGFIITFRNCTTSGSAVSVVSTAANDGSGTAVTIGGATTTSDNNTVLAVVGGHGSSSITISSYTNGDLASFTERVDAAVTTRQHVSAATGDKTTAGAYGNTTATLSSALCWAGITVALKP